jgi:phenylalanyl-tRNA synthetase beta subunit
MDLAVKALIKTMDTAKPNPSKIEIVVIRKDEKDEVKGNSLKVAEIEQVLKRCGFNVEKMEIE